MVKQLMGALILRWFWLILKDTCYREYRAWKWDAWFHKCAVSAFALSGVRAHRDGKDKCQTGDILRGNIFKRPPHGGIDTTHHFRTGPCGSHMHSRLTTLIIFSRGPWWFTSTQRLYIYLVCPRSPHQVSKWMGTHGARGDISSWHLFLTAGGGG